VRNATDEAGGDTKTLNLLGRDAANLQKSGLRNYFKKL